MKSEIGREINFNNVKKKMIAGKFGKMSKVGLIGHHQGPLLSYFMTEGLKHGHLVLLNA